MPSYPPDEKQDASEDGFGKGPHLQRSYPLPEVRLPLYAGVKKGKVRYLYLHERQKGTASECMCRSASFLSPCRLFKAFEGISREVQERLVEELRKSNEAEIEFRNREVNEGTGRVRPDAAPVPMVD